MPIKHKIILGTVMIVLIGGGSYGFITRQEAIQLLELQQEEEKLCRTIQTTCWGDACPSSPESLFQQIQHDRDICESDITTIKSKYAPDTYDRVIQEWKNEACRVLRRKNPFIISG